MKRAPASSIALLDEAGAIAARAASGTDERPANPRSSRRDRSLWALGASLLLGLLLRWQYWSLTRVIGTDGAWYATLGVNLLHGRGYTDATGAVNVFFPPLYPVGVGLASFVVRDPEAAGRLVSLLAGLTLVGVVFALARLAFDRRVAAGAAFLAALLPTLANNSVLVLSDRLYTCCLYAALLAGVLAWRAAGPRRLAWHALTGAFLAATALARPEGYLHAAAWVAWLVAQHGAAGRRGDLRRPLGGALLVAALAYVVVLSPYLVFLRHETGAWRLTTKTATNVVVAYRGAAADEHNRYSLNAAGTAEGGFEANHDSLLAELRRAPLGFAKHYRTELQTESTMLFDQLTPALLLLVPLGLFALPWPTPRRPACAALLLPLLQLGFLPLFPIEPRYLLAVLPATLIFAAAGALALAER
ncbi:MAG TPA: glycosyltransferase family 39 protein, partial [Thermomicrobiales bacterium]|nr:glycosyltransferase family 39 protein [Thermomicrobiales bacterium]